MSRYFSLCCSANAVANTILDKIVDISNIETVIVSNAEHVINKTMQDISNVDHVVSHTTVVSLAAAAINDKISDISNIQHVVASNDGIISADQISNVHAVINNTILDISNTVVEITNDNRLLYDNSMNIISPRV